MKNKRILITCGPTWVPLDDVRVISNRSSGELGQLIARECARKGAKVTLLQGPVKDELRRRSIRTRKFVFFDDLSKLIDQELRKKYDVCVHAAAVSDFRPRKTKPGKIDSKHKKMKISLMATPKLIRRIKKADPRIFLVGFKLAPKISRISAKRITRDLFAKNRCDLVVANTLKNGRYTGYLLDRKQKILKTSMARKHMAQTLVNTIRERL